MVRIMGKIKNSVLNISIENYKEYVFERFKELCGFFKNTEIDGSRVDEAVLCFWESLNALKVKAVYSFFDSDIFNDNDIYINEYIFSEILKSNISEFVFFAVSADTGTFDIKKTFDGNILKEFYFDLTGTSVIDVSRSILKSFFEKFDYVRKSNLFVSKAFGPGFFGMKHKEIFRFFKLLDCDKIGLFLNNSGVIYPNKSFIGFFVISEKKIFIEDDCKNCIGGGNGCFFCEKTTIFRRL